MDRDEVKPEQDENVVELSPIDQIQPRGYIRVILCFPLKADADTSSIAQALEISLKATTSRWPIFGGTVALMRDGGEHSGRLEIRYSAASDVESIQLHVKNLTRDEFPCSYEELDKAGMPLLPLDEALLCSVPAVPQSINPVPAALVQANFISGGLLMSICLHHGITDGKGASLFISAFADACRSGGKIASIPAMNSSSKARGALFHTLPWKAPDTHLAYRGIKSTIASSNGMIAIEPEDDATTNCLFTFPATCLQDLKKSVTANIPSPGRGVSTNDCLAALLWSCITRARTPNLPTSSMTSSFAVAVDVRARASPPLSPNYAGAAVVHSIATTNLSTLTCPTSSLPSRLAKLALLIRKSLQDIDGKYVSETASLSAAFPDIRQFSSKTSPVHGADLVLTSWKEFPYYDMDFGDLGKPQWVRKPWSRHAAVIVVLPKDNDKNERKEGIEVILMLRRDVMDRLLQDVELMQRVGRVVE